MPSVSVREIATDFALRPLGWVQETVRLSQFQGRGRSRWFRLIHVLPVSPFTILRRGGLALPSSATIGPNDTRTLLSTRGPPSLLRHPKLRLQLDCALR
jgi:hypothetical protein